MTAELLLLSFAFACMAGGLAHLAVAIKRIAWAWLMSMLDHAAAQVR